MLSSFGRRLLFLWLCVCSPSMGLCGDSSGCQHKKILIEGSPFGTISDGPKQYAEDSYCIWLIKAKDRQYINVKFKFLDVHCTDRLTLYDGNSTSAPKIGSYSGSGIPLQVYAASGSLLVQLFSDSQDVSEGFILDYYIGDCILNCSGRGECVDNVCSCNFSNSGVACELESCESPVSVNNRFCENSKVESQQPGIWHLLHSDGISRGLARAGHSAIYSEQDDRIFIFGGTNLNSVNGDLISYDFKTKQWLNFSEKFVVQNFKSSQLVLQDLNNVPETTIHSLIPDNFTDIVNLQDDLVTSPSENVLASRYANAKNYFLSENQLKEEHIVYKRDLNDPRFIKKASEKPESPTARYFHAVCSFRNGFMLFGGIHSDGSLSNSLWFYNFASSDWTHIKTQKFLPKLHKHALVAVNNTLYVIGGVRSNGLISSKVYKLELNDDLGVQSDCEEVRLKGEKLPAIAGHTSVYDVVSGRILIYGGIIPINAKETAMSDRIYMFGYKETFLSEVHFHKIGLMENHVPAGRAYHTANIIGRYMVVSGGLTSTSGIADNCVDSALYFYHLDCHVWVARNDLARATASELHPGSMYSHSSVVRNSSTLVIHGGFSGSTRGSLWSYTVPDELLGSEKEGYNYCYRHKTQVSCTGNPICGWCPTDGSCTRRNDGTNCSTNLQTIACPGICSSLRNCEACTQASCVWCVHSAKCHKKEDNIGICGTGFETPSGINGFWGGDGVDISDPDRCRAEDVRPGITFMVYEHPANFTQPDYVSILNATSAKFSFSTKTPQSFSDGYVTARMVGYIYPTAGKSRNDLDKKVFIETVNASSTLMISKDESVMNLETVGVSSLLDSSTNRIEVLRTNQSLLFPESGRGQKYLVEFIAKMPITELDGSASMMLTWSSKVGTRRPFTFEYLEPYINGSCFYTNCQHCLTDAKCVWCESQQRCQQRDSDICATDSDWLVLNPSQCRKCDFFVDCEECLESSLCEWVADKAVCTRRGRIPGAVVTKDSCPLPCHQRLTCGLCLGGPEDCTWCDATQECFSFSSFLVQYPFGTCSSWTGQEPTSTLANIFDPAPTRGDLAFSRRPSAVVALVDKSQRGGSVRKEGRCSSCEQKDRCHLCLREPSCGWCFSVHNPLLGVCTSGDFFSPKSGNCSSVLQGLDVLSNSEMPRWDWSFSECPDIDECSLLLADCHPDAVCKNTHLSYTCTCKRGFVGDGHENCSKTRTADASCEGLIHMLSPYKTRYCLTCQEKTSSDFVCHTRKHKIFIVEVKSTDSVPHCEGKRCYEECVHGTCSGPPDYQCICDLGWTGADCSVDCQCHGHASCSLRVGICDECQHQTTGLRCHFCRAGSYGDPTTRNGCQTCFCNGHGNSSAGVCDPGSGICFCMDNTEGPHCERCKNGYYGDPRNGGTCYRECSSRAVLSGSSYAHLGSPVHSSSSYSDCLWVLSVHGDVGEEGKSSDKSIIQLTIHADSVLPCPNNHVYVFDGIPSFRTSETGFGRNARVVAALCSPDSVFPRTVEAYSGLMTIRYKRSDSMHGFNATFQVLTCLNGSCPSEMFPGRRNCSEAKEQGKFDEDHGRCVCSPGFIGDDCSQLRRPSSIVFRNLVDPSKLSDKMDHWRYVLPRFGHSLIADHKGSLWLFGGQSLSRGSLNDIREFDTKTEIWLQVTINIDPGSQSTFPEGRAFHGAAFVPSQRSIYFYGGLSSSDYLYDMWKFDVISRKWMNITNGNSLPLAGHTMTLVEDGETESLVVIGGFNPTSGLNDEVLEFSVERQQWTTLATSGTQPIGIYGHSTVYHPSTKSLYVFGGVVFKLDRLVNSSSLYALHYPTKKWSLLTTVMELNPPEANVPAALYHHSAVTTDSAMIVAGGFADPHSLNDTLLAYIYACNYWMPLNMRELDVVGPQLRASAGIALARQSGTLFAFGGFGQGIDSGLTTRIDLPDDLCAVYSHRKDLCRLSPGCSYCSRQNRFPQNTTMENASVCYTEPVEGQPALSPSQCQHPSVLVSKRTACGKEKITSRNCYAYSSCSECLGEWPIYRGSPQACQWCTNCKSGKCVPLGANCQEENRCEVKQRETVDASQCLERTCLASNCDKCKESGRCIWTRQVLRISEQSRKLHTLPIYDWNCVRRNIKDSASFLVSSTPPQPCPTKCSEYKNCKDCLSATGAEGGASECFWSVTLSQCISPAYIPLQCLGGICGTILSGDAEMCPKSCNQFKKCADCLRQPECGWCGLESISMSGLGVCTPGSLDGPKEGSCAVVDYSRIADSYLGAGANSTVSWRKSPSKVATLISPPDRYARWHYSSCPPEDECKNGHHNCDPVSEKCVDTLEGYECLCTDGYKGDGTTCKPICSQGCLNGDCTAPNVCTCHFGYVGLNCSLQCDCNGHSACAGTDQLDVCLECRNNTMGNQCDRCQPLFVGDPRKNGHCVSCLEYCSGHSAICLSVEYAEKNLSQPFRNIKWESQSLTEWQALIGEGPRSAAICVGCRNATDGEKCEDCIPGFFRGVDDKRKTCRPCECHSHGDMCDPVSGEGCNCRNNTESDPQCRFGGGFLSARLINTPWGSLSSNKSPQPCWALQCDRCRESFLGNPVNGHQCYRQMTVDTTYCLDQETQESCNLEPKYPNPLLPYRTVFFAIQPKFMNVDIRLIVDASPGSVDVYIAPKDDIFVVRWSSRLGAHSVDIDPKYVLPINIGVSNSSQSERYTVAYRVQEREANGLLTFLSVDDPFSIVIIRNLKNRLVLTLPQSKHDLRSTRFYAILRSSGAVATHGFLLFRQDQPRIDLFVFFSVFFSCFFLFLAASVIVWKVKNVVDGRRARTRHVQEMQTMARRPSGKVSVCFDTETIPLSTDQGEIEIEEVQGGCRQRGIVPVACEPLGDGRAGISTVLIEMPGGRQVPSRLILGSTFVLTGTRSDEGSRKYSRRQFRVRFRRQDT